MRLPRYRGFAQVVRDEPLDDKLVAIRARPVILSLFGGQRKLEAEHKDVHVQGAASQAAAEFRRLPAPSCRPMSRRSGRCEPASPGCAWRIPAEEPAITSRATASKRVRRLRVHVRIVKAARARESSRSPPKYTWHPGTGPTRNPGTQQRCHGLQQSFRLGSSRPGSMPGVVTVAGLTTSNRGVSGFFAVASIPGVVFNARMFQPTAIGME